MKTEGILQLVALVRAKREGAALARDILFLATADEEAGFAGALFAGLQVTVSPNDFPMVKSLSLFLTQHRRPTCASHCACGRSQSGRLSS